MTIDTRTMLYRVGGGYAPVDDFEDVVRRLIREEIGSHRVKSKWFCTCCNTLNSMKDDRCSCCRRRQGDERNYILTRTRKSVGVDEVVQAIRQWLLTEFAQNGPSPFVMIHDDHTVTLDGDFDLRALANAIVNGKTSQ
jgi:hypothetical protein